MISDRERELIAAGRTCEHCGKPTSMGCARCFRILCASHAACNLATMTHITGLSCDRDAPRGVPAQCSTCGHVPAGHTLGDGWCSVCPDQHCQPQEEPTDPWGQPFDAASVLPREAK